MVKILKSLDELNTVECELNKWYIRVLNYPDFDITELIYLKSYNSEYASYSGCNISRSLYKYPDNKVEVITTNSNKTFGPMYFMDFEECGNPLEYLNSWAKKYFDLCNQEIKEQ